MSLHVWRCVCGRRWYQFRRAQWDSVSAPSMWCPGCRPDEAEGLEGWAEL